jgi:hypothetical protein
VTEKTEHEGGAEAAPADESEATDARAVPSIVIDPALAAFSRKTTAAPDAISNPAQGNGSTRQGAQGAAVATGSAPPPAPTEGDGMLATESNGGLSAEDAERFAASIRPSWEPPEGKDYGAGAATPAIATGAAARNTAAAVLPAGAVEDIKGLPGSQRRRGLLITTAAVLSFLALAALGIMTSRPDVPTTRQPTGVSASNGAARKTALTAPKPVVSQKTAPIAVPAPAIAPSASDVAAPSTPVAAAAPPAAAPALPPTAVTVPPATTPAAVTVQPAAPAAAAPPIAAGPPQPPAGVVANATPVSERPRAPVTVHMQIAARPSHARMTLDGSPIPNPFEADVIKGGKHRLQAHADGHRSSDITVNFDRDRDITLKLDPIATPTARPKKARRARPAAQPAASAPKPARPAAEAAPARGAGFVSESPY